jgi:hypothetical protein
MPKRDGHIPGDAELDRLAEITDADIDDAARSLKQRVPKATRAVDAMRDDSAGGVRGPIADNQ